MGANVPVETASKKGSGGRVFLSGSRNAPVAESSQDRGLGTGQGVMRAGMTATQKIIFLPGMQRYDSADTDKRTRRVHIEYPAEFCTTPPAAFYLSLIIAAMFRNGESRRL